MRLSENSHEPSGFQTRPRSHKPLARYSERDHWSASAAPGRVRNPPLHDAQPVRNLTPMSSSSSIGVATSAAYGVELTPENGPQSLVGGAAVPMVVFSEGEFSKSNMSSSVSAN